MPNMAISGAVLNVPHCEMHPNLLYTCIVAFHATQKKPLWRENATFAIYVKEEKQFYTVAGNYI